MNIPHICRDCGQPMEAKEQSMFNKPSLTIITCQNHDCTLFSVTLTPDQYNQLSGKQVQDYRDMVARLKATLAKQGGES